MEWMESSDSSTQSTTNTSLLSIVLTTIQQPNNIYLLYLFNSGTTINNYIKRTNKPCVDLCGSAQPKIGGLLYTISTSETCLFSLITSTTPNKNTVLLYNNVLPSSLSNSNINKVIK
ncbi:hypothetical protein ACTFIR_005295 [Dictyostelium discoideum]